VRARSALAVLAGAALLVSAAPAQAARKKTINIGDNYFAPASVKVEPRTVVTWKWPSFDMAGDVHDVKLKSGPRHVKKFHSQPAASDYSFKRKLTVVGKYTVICTLHENMKMTIRVRR
jgi:plastocyanin